MIGTPASTARRKAPSLNSCNSPDSERVPSGKMITDTRLSSMTRHCFNAFTALRPELRSSGMSPAIRISHPTSGNLKNSALLSHFISNGRCEMSRMSTKLSWLATTTYGRRGSAGRLPDDLEVPQRG